MPEDQQAPKQRRPRKATARSLENAALFYLRRFSSSAENLRRVLMRRVERSARLHGTDRNEGAAFVDAIVARFRDSGLVDDHRYADGRARSLLRRGASPRKVRATLAAKGVARDVTDAALSALEGDVAALDLWAAVNLARRRRLGPFRVGADRAERREKDLAALARAGFSLDVARQVIDAADGDALAAEVDAGAFDV